MSEIDYCPTGGMNGILVTKDELIEFSDLNDSKYLDEFIPLPDKEYPYNEEEHDCSENASYWEIDGEHSHGWCCTICGKVIQWG